MFRIGFTARNDLAETPDKRSMSSSSVSSRPFVHDNIEACTAQRLQIDSRSAEDLLNVAENLLHRHSLFVFGRWEPHTSAAKRSFGIIGGGFIIRLGS